VAPPSPLPPAFPFGPLLRDQRGDVLVASEFDGLYRRSPGEGHWTKALDLRPHTVVFAFDGGDQGWYFAIDEGTSRKMLRTTDGGRHWNTLPSTFWPRAVAHGHLYSIGSDALLRSSTDRGSSWQVLGALPGDVDFLGIASVSTLYASTRDHRYFRSEDSGAHWTSFALPLSDALLYVGPGGKLYAKGPEQIQRRKEVHAIMDVGVYRSDDGGRRWERERFGEPDGDQPIDIMFANERSVVAFEWPDRLCVRGAAHTGAWIGPRGYYNSGETHADFHAEMRDDGVWFSDVVGDDIVTRQAFSRTGLPDPYSGRPLTY
jgi:hypothetical protein